MLRFGVASNKEASNVDSALLTWGPTLVELRELVQYLISDAAV